MYSKEHKQALLGVASESIVHALDTGVPLPVAAESFPSALQELRATFVTLQLDRRLRGCIGTVKAIRPLVVDVARHAHAAAFSDPRFPPLNSQEVDLIELQISILSPLEPLCFSSEQELITLIRPGIDGLLLEDGTRRATLLPSVWQSVPNPREFIRRLKKKACLSSDYWSNTIEVARYGSEGIDSSEIT